MGSFAKFCPLGIAAEKGGAWTPADVSPLAWYDASDASTITEAAGAVSQWDDKSGNLRHVSQGVGANQPTYNLSDEIDFNGSSDYLFNSSPIMYDASNFSVFVVCSIGSSSFNQIVSEGNSANSTVAIWPVESGIDGAMEAFYRNDSGSTLLNHNNLSGTGVYDGTRKLFEVKDTGSAISARINGGSETTSAYTRSGAVTLNRFAVGCGLRNTAAFFIDGGVNELVITPNLTTVERLAMETYLSDKWSL